MAFGTGYVFGSTLGTEKGVPLAALSNFLGSSIGALCAFLLVRYLFRGGAAMLLEKYKIFRAIDRAMEGNGFKIMLLLRLSPLPFNVIDYVSGMTSVSLRDYALALFGLIPNACVVSLLGASA